MVRVGTKIPQDGNRANRYGHVAMVHGHGWRTVCSIGATGACFWQPFPWNLKRDCLTCISNFGEDKNFGVTTFLKTNENIEKFQIVH